MLRKTFKICCPQGHVLTVSAFHVGLQVPCPTCEALVVVPAPEEAAAEMQLVPGIDAGKARPAPVVLLAEEDEDEPRRLPDHEYTALARVRLGLSFLLAEVVIWVLGFITLFVLVLSIGLQAGMEFERDDAQGQAPANLPGDRDFRAMRRDRDQDPVRLQKEERIRQRTQELAKSLEERIKLGVEIVVFSAHTLWIVGVLFCLSVPVQARARGLLLAALLCVVVRTVLLFLIASMQLVQLILLGGWIFLVTILLSPALYKSFLARLSNYLGRRDLGRQSLYLTIAWYMLLGSIVAIGIATEFARQNQQGVHVLLGLFSLGVLFGFGIWFIFYVIFLVRLRGSITRFIAA